MRLVSFSFYLSGSSIKDLDNPLRVQSIPSDSTVLRLKQIIQNATVNVDAARLSIFYSGKLMEDHHTVGHYIPSTANETATHVAAQLVVAPEHTKVVVVVIPSEAHRGGGVRVRSDSSVRELKDKICRKMGFFDVAITTCSNGAKVEDDSAPISRFGIGEGSRIRVNEALNVSPR
ncbi:unnamed protein product [Linum tenue]|uniref:Ubiquitin-like domain-containing protein n=1 Tax=Linum tenue TaxID=586396 RepID=A0AAV0IYX5_9ROSI|nr:unnamed protein product [Linum tenue]